MNITYITSARTNGANPFQIFTSLAEIDKDELGFILKQMSYPQFMKTAYWFAVSHTCKARAGMRCQVCNQGNSIQVHHRTYATHGFEHLNMMDLVVLCSDCHGLFHGHKEKKPEAKAEFVPVRKTEITNKPVFVPAGDVLILTREMINAVRTNGSFTNATLNALGLKFPLASGWVGRMVGLPINREDYLAAIEGIGHYRVKKKNRT